jgi:hypothetical protein
VHLVVAQALVSVYHDGEDFLQRDKLSYALEANLVFVSLIHMRSTGLLYLRPILIALSALCYDQLI